MTRGSRIALALALASLAGSVAACGGDDEATPAAAEEGEAFIDPTTGEDFGLAPDERLGTEPPPVEEADLEQAAEAAGCELELDLRDEGRNHIPESRPTDYRTSPPTSGDHDAVPLADGAYLEEPDPRFFVHSLEHGRVVIAYRPDLAEADQLALKGLLDSDPDGMLLIPYADMPYEVAAVSWTNLLGCDSSSPEAIDALAAFRDELRGQGPEDIPL